MVPNKIFDNVPHILHMATTNMVQDIGYFSLRYRLLFGKGLSRCRVGLSGGCIRGGFLVCRLGGICGRAMFSSIKGRISRSGGL